MKAKDIPEGVRVRHNDELKYVKVKSFTMGNIIYMTMRHEDGTLERIQATPNEDFEVVG